MKNLLLLILLYPCVGFSQIEGSVVNKKTKEPVYGAKLAASSGEKAITDFDGKFKLDVRNFPVYIVISAQSYITDSVKVTGPGELKIVLKSEVQEIKTVVVTSGRRDQNIEDVPISMEIIRPELIENKGIANLEEAVDQSPGVFTMDGQVSIRGGSGFAYGAGSRVLLLWNGIPILSGDAGDAKWNSIPMECASQIEILKGASSVLYGSGALNGIISLTEREPGLKGEIRAKIQTGVYDNPRRATLKWWSMNPMFYQGDVYYGKMFKKVGFTLSTNAYTTEGYKEGEKEKRARLSGTIYFRPEKLKSMKAGIGYNLQFQETGNFIIWQSDTFAYTPSGGADLSDSASTLTVNKGVRFSIDPYVKIYDKNKNLHSFQSRFYAVGNTNVTNTAQSSNSTILYGDYQFQHKWEKSIALTAGLTGIRTDVLSNLFGDHFSINYAVYGQYEHNFKKLDLTAGMRLEYYEQDNTRGDSDFYLNADSTSKLPVYPIFRFGAHYEIAKATHVRASFGQGIRYPSVAERYTSTSVGALNVFANPYLTPETGWAAEIGFKQGVKIGDNWKGLIDVAGFINKYDNMMEFTFGIFNPANSERLDPSSPDYNTQVLDIISAGYSLNQMIGFSAENAESATIAGFEVSFNSQGSIGDVQLTSLLGYTYMDPKTNNTDTSYLSTFSTYDGPTATYDPMLKYRFNHLVKVDIEAQWKGFSLGWSARYSSHMVNIDKIFQTDIAGTTILPGILEYREKYNKGNLVFDMRFGYSFMDHYRIGFIVNNMLNNEYSSRPGDVQAPRNFILQLQMKF